MKFAVFTVSTPTWSPEETAAKLHEYGYEGIEWRVVDEPPNPKGMDFWHGNKATIPATGFGTYVDMMKRVASEHGLEIPALGTYVSCMDPIDAIEAAMQQATEVGAPKLRVRVPNYDDSTSYVEAFDVARDRYKVVEDLARKHTVQALVELHHGTICPSASAGRRFVDGLDPEYIGIIHDCGNMVYEGYENYRMGLEVLGPYLAHVHVKNAKWIPLNFRKDRTVNWLCMAAAVQKGIADLWELFRGLRAVGYDGWITLEDFSTERYPDERLPENLVWMRKILEEVDAGLEHGEPIKTS